MFVLEISTHKQENKMVNSDPVGVGKLGQAQQMQQVLMLLVMMLIPELKTLLWLTV